MNYSIKRKEQNGLQLVVLRDDKSGVEVSVLPGFGALLHGFSVESDEGIVDVIDHYESLDQLNQQLPTSYKSSKLSPFPCRIGEGKYSFDGKNYEFSNKFGDGSAIHGLLFNKAFSIVEEKAGNGSCKVALEYEYNRDDDQYPFHYSCMVNYELLPDQVLDVETVITNLGTVSMPVADGWHPYFTLDGKVDDWVMHFKAEGMVEFNDKLIPTGNMVGFEQFNLPSVIGKTFLDNCFFIKPDPELPSCELFNPINKLKISFFPGPSYPYLQIYTPPHRKSIAIENLSSAPDSFNNKMGLTILQPGSSESFSLQYKVAFL